MRLFLQEEDSTSAETYFNRASLLIHTTHDPELVVLFKSCAALMFDFSRKFAEAASRYHELSYEARIQEDDRLQSLSVARSLRFPTPGIGEERVKQRIELTRCCLLAQLVGHHVRHPRPRRPCPLSPALVAVPGRA